MVKIEKVNAIESTLSAKNQQNEHDKVRRLSELNKIDSKNVEAVRYRNEIGDNVEEVKNKVQFIRSLGNSSKSAFQAMLEIEQDKLNQK